MATYQQLLASLVDSEDAPVPQRTTSLVKPVGEVRAKHIASTGAVAALFGLIATALFYWQHWIWGGIFGLLTVAMLQSAFSSKLWVAACPYCSEVFDPLAGGGPGKERKVRQE